jgi:ferredoxin-NADP reductase
MIERDVDDSFKLEVYEKFLVTKDTIWLSLAFPDETWISGVWAGGHFDLELEINGQRVVRSYSVISPVCQQGTIEFLIKVYKPHPELEKEEEKSENEKTHAPDYGLFTRHLEKHVDVGDQIKCFAPLGNIKYLGYGIFEHNFTVLKRKSLIGLLAAGSGITPLYSIAQASAMSNDNVKLNLVYSAKTKHDILLK